MKKIFYLLKHKLWLALTLFGGLGLPLLAEAQTGLITAIASAPFTAGLTVILYILQYLGGMLFSLGGVVASFFLHLNYTILEGNQFISLGWNIVRDIANLGFVLLIIFIAVATILRYQDYEAKKLLVRLITAAIAVNFSLAIAGVLIDFSHVLTKTFFGAITSASSPGAAGVWQDSVQLVDALSSAFAPQNLIIQPSTDLNSLPTANTGIFADALIGISALAFSTAFTFIGAICLLAFAFMLMVRYIWLSFLLIVSPIAWLFSVIPNQARHFSEWWGKFIQWTFFAPVVSFFFYLALKSVYVLAGQDTQVLAGNFFAANPALGAFAAQGTKMLILTGLLIGGMMAAQSLGITGAGWAIGTAKGLGNWSKKQLSTGGARAVDKTLRTTPGKWITEKLQLGSRYTLGLTGIAGNYLAKRRVADEKRLEDEAKKLPSDFKEMARLASASLPVRQAAILSKISDETKARRENLEAGNKAFSKAESRVAEAEKELNRAKTEGDGEKIKKANNILSDAKEELEKATKRRDKVNKEIKEMIEVLSLIPKTIREEVATITRDGEITSFTEFKDTKRGRRWKDSRVVKATKEKSSKQELEDLFKKIEEEAKKTGKEEAKKAEEKLT